VPEPTSEPEPTAMPEPTAATQEAEPTRPKGSVTGPRQRPTRRPTEQPTEQPTEKPTEEPAATRESPVEQTIRVSDLVPLHDLDSFALQTFVDAYAQDEQGYITASREFTSRPDAERVFVQIEVEDEDESLTQIIQIGDTTYVEEDGSGNWEVSDDSLPEMLDDSNLKWMLDPYTLVGDAEFDFVETWDDDGVEYKHYVAEAAILEDTPMFEGYDLDEGQVDLWIDTELQIVSEIMADVSGVDDVGDVFEMYLDMYVTDVNAEIDIQVPDTDGPATDRDLPTSLYLGDLDRVEDLDSYRLYIYVLQDTPSESFAAEILREYSGVPGEERLVFGGWTDDERVFAEMIQVGNTTWVDDGTGGNWEAVADDIEDLIDLSDILPAEALAPLNDTEGQLVGEETVRGMTTGRYTWGVGDLAEELGDGLISAQADVWVSAEFNVPVQIEMTIEQEDELMLVQYVVTNINEWISIPTPEDTCCPEAEALLLGDWVENEVTAGDTVCYKFIALEGERRTLDIDTYDEDVDLELEIYDGDCYWAHYNDDGPDGWAPLLTFAPYQSGVYYAEISGLSDYDAGEFVMSFTLFDETTDTPDDAILLEPGETVESAITDESLLYLPEYEETLYGQAFAFEGETGDEVTVTVLADVLGSDLDPLVTLLDPDADWIIDDDDSYGGLDSLLEYELDQTGLYYLVVTSATDSVYGSTRDFYFEISLEID